MVALSGRRPRTRAAASGFTLVELVVTLLVLGIVTIAIMAVIYRSTRSKTSTMNQIESVQTVRAAIDMLSKDLRSAGYGSDLDYAAQPQPSIAYVDSTQVLITANLAPNTDTVEGHSPPLAYDPAGSPRPFPLNGTPYTPPIRYRTGAEIIRWTLDVNNDGTVNSGDLDAPDGADARRTQNPDDYVLVRQVYGDSTGNVAGANGGAIERIALVRNSGGDVPSIFTVYFKDNPVPWDWKNGPVPASQLANIARIKVQLSASSPKRGADGTYAHTTLSTEVGSSRNLRNFNDKLYPIDGYVYEDKNKNLQKDSGEPGIPNATLVLGSGYLGARTDATGHFVFQMPAGSYRLKHIAPTGYGVFTNPDSTVVTVGPSASYSFADTARHGGFVHVTAYLDDDRDGMRDGGERGQYGIRVTATPGPDVQYTDDDGKTTLFAPVGAYTVTLSAPDSFYTTTPNPVNSTIGDQDTASVAFGLATTPPGTIAGKVFRDVNKNGVHDFGESGMANVWVGATRDGGLTVTASSATDYYGDYQLVLPANDPPRTQPYTVFFTPPTGYFPTGPSSLSPVWVKEDEVVSGKNFGVLAFQIISLEAARVLSLARGDLVEKDWPLGLTQSRVRDVDLVLGSDSNGSDQISAWFNRYNADPLYPSSRDYGIAVPGSVFSLAVDTLDAAGSLGRERADVVAGTNWVSWGSAKGNVFVFLTQGTSGNEGYLPSSPTRVFSSKDKCDVTALLTADLSGPSTAPDGVDVVVGTTCQSRLGSFEVWRNTNAGIPDWKILEVYPTAGSIPNDFVGAVSGMALADFDGDGLRDLVVTSRTPTGNYSGQILFMKNMGRTAVPVFQYQSQYILSSDVVTCVTVADVDVDGRPDVVVGAFDSPSSGNVQYWRNTTPVRFEFTQTAVVKAPGIVTAIASTDLGGGSRKDIAVGYRATDTGYGGGVRIYYTDMGTLVGPGTDPTGGAVVNFVPTIATGNFDYGVFPLAPFPPHLDDVALGVKVSDTTGALVILVR